MSEKPPSNRKGRPRGSGAFPWRAFFQQSTTPVYVLGKGRRLRFANAAWEKLTGLKLADALGMVCSLRRHSTPLAHALAPSQEAEAGKPDRVRRVAPSGRSGPPWWDVSFAPLAGSEGPIGIVGFVTVVGEIVVPAVRKMPAFVAALRDQHAAAYSLDLYAGPAVATEHFQGQLRHAAASSAPVWMVGEAGSGKETAARALHHASPLRNRAFVGIACAGLQPYLIESLLFGHGGLIGSAQIGTLYLKEPSSLPRDLQQRLADLFGETKPDTPRLISGSMRPAVEEVASGKLIPEFHTELSVIELRVPPLRDRLADLPRLVARFLPETVVDPAVLEVLGSLPWTGNLRELAEVLASAVQSAGKGPIQVAHLPHHVRVRAGLEATAPKQKSIALDPLLEAVERRMIALAMKRSHGNATKAAELLGIFRARLGRRLDALGLNQGEEG